MEFKYTIVVVAVVLFVKNNSSEIQGEQIKNSPEKRILSKCCRFGESVNIKNCVKTNETFGNLNFSEVPLYYPNLTKTGRFIMDVYRFEPGRFANVTFRKSAYTLVRKDHRYYLTEDSFLYEDIPNEFYRWFKVTEENFCVDYLLPNKLVPAPEVRFFTVVISKDSLVDDANYVTAGLLISSGFMVLVLLVYSLLPELRNIGGLILMAYVFSMLMAFLFLVILKLASLEPIECKILTYFTYFFFLASFCWMNVMSCDIWWTFRGYAKARPIHRRGECFKFLMYCVYAWGLPLAMSVMLAILDNINMRHTRWFITPNIPLKTCFIGESEKRFYLYIPMLVLILCNWMFFLMTAFNIWRLSRGTAVLDSAAAGTTAAHRKQRYRFLVYLKLSIIMGINWVLEVASSFKPDLKLWRVSDLYNVLIGLSIFLIFVCKRKIFRKLAKKFSGWNESRFRKTYFRSRSSNTTDSDISQDAPIQVCSDPKGPPTQFTKI